jgi:hypothetical protein
VPRDEQPVEVSCPCGVSWIEMVPEGAEVDLTEEWCAFCLEGAEDERWMP